MKNLTALMLIVLALIVMAVANVAVFHTSQGDSLMPHAVVMGVCMGVIFISMAFLIVRVVAAMWKDQDKRYGK